MNENAVQSRTDLASFVTHLAASLEDSPTAWENTSLPSFLDAFARYLHDPDGWCRNNEPGTDPEVAQWRLFAIALAGAAVYE
jgi:hypothetical protein